MGRSSRQTTRRPVRRWLVGLLILAATAAVIGWFARMAINAGWFAGLDALAGQTAPSPGVASFAQGVSETASALSAAIASVVLAIVLLVRRRAGESVILIGSAATAILAQNLLRDWVNRVPAADSVVTQAGSFPSSHAFFSVAVYGLFAYFLIRALRSAKARIVTGLVAVLLVLLVAYSRVALQTQHVSDVLFGLLLGVVWLVVGAWVTHGPAKQSRRSSFRR